VIAKGANKEHGKVPSTPRDAAEISGWSSKRKGGPGGDDSGGKDRSTLNDVCSELIAGKPGRLYGTFSLLLLFQFISLSLEVVEMASACLMKWLDQRIDKCGGSGQPTICVSWVMTFTASSASF